MLENCDSNTKDRRGEAPYVVFVTLISRSEGKAHIRPDVD
jgi:hypothetical protein